MNLGMVEETKNDFIPTNAPENIIYQIGHAAVNQLTTNQFDVFPKTGQDTVACL